MTGNETTLFQNPILNYTTVGIVGAFLGAIGKWIAERVFDNYAPTSILLKRLKDGNISNKSQIKLLHEAKATVEQLQLAWQPPEGERTIELGYVGKAAIFPHELTDVISHTSCPAGTIHKGQIPAYLELSIENNLLIEHKNIIELSQIVNIQLGNIITEFEKNYAKLSLSEIQKQLLSQVTVPNTNLPVLWINIPAFIPQSMEDVIQLVKRLEETSKQYFRSLSIILEIPLPMALVSCLYKNNQILIKEPGKITPEIDSMKLPDSKRHVFLYDKLINYFNDGFFFTHNSNGNSLSISENFIQAQYSSQLKRLLQEPLDWTSVSIWGQPGTCKSTFSNFLARKLVEQQKYIIIHCLPIIMEKLAEKDSLEELANYILEDSEITLPIYLNDNVSRLAFFNCFTYFLKHTQRKLILLLDELHAHQHLREKLLATKRQNAKFENIKFILEGRIELEPEQNEELISVEMNLLNREQAKYILKDWLYSSSNHLMNVDDIIERSWIRNYKVYSTHLLRLCVEHMTSLTEAPSELLSKKLELYLKPIDQTLNELHKAYATDSVSPELISKIKSFLREKRSYDELESLLASTEMPNLRELLGLLSWISRFDIQEGDLTSAKVSKWAFSNGHYVLPDGYAKTLLDSGVKVGIFDKFQNSYAWCEPIVADGCAALFLASRIDQTQETIVAEMIAKLAEQNSLDVLFLALDIGTLQELIKIVFTSHRNLAQVVDHLITPSLLSALDEKPEWANKVISTIIIHANNLIYPQLLPICSALAKLTIISDELKNKCYDILNLTEAKTNIYLGIRAILEKDSKNFFITLNNNEFDSYQILETAAYSWSINGIEPFLDALETQAIKLSVRQYLSLWKVWTDKLEIDDLFSLQRTLIKRIQLNNANEALANLYCDLSEQSIKAAVLYNPRLAQRYTSSIVGIASQLAKKGQHRIAGILSKWAAYAEDPDLVGQNDICWVVDKGGQYALPMETYSPLTANQILGSVYQRNRFSLASREELYAIDIENKEITELVRDGFGERYNPQRSYPAVSYQLKSIKKDDFISKEELQTKKILWRPQFHLTDATP